MTTEGVTDFVAVGTEVKRNFREENAKDVLFVSTSPINGFERDVTGIVKGVVLGGKNVLGTIKGNGLGRHVIRGGHTASIGQIRNFANGVFESITSQKARKSHKGLKGYVLFIRH